MTQQKTWCGQGRTLSGSERSVLSSPRVPMPCADGRQEPKQERAKNGDRQRNACVVDRGRCHRELHGQHERHLDDAGALLPNQAHDQAHDRAAYKGPKSELIGPHAWRMRALVCMGTQRLFVQCSGVLSGWLCQPARTVMTRTQAMDTTPM